MTTVGEEQEDSGWGVLGQLPGDPMIWILIFSEFAAFGVLLGAFCVTRIFNPAMFASGQAVLDAGLAGSNTIVLVTSGWAAAHGAKAACAGDRRRSRLWLYTAMLFGAVFIAIKLTEYAGEMAGGIGLETNTFFTLYFLLTGFHLLHVALGIVILGLVSWNAESRSVETGTSFWHMVDLIWIVMFPILYLVH